MNGHHAFLDVLSGPSPAATPTSSEPHRKMLLLHTRGQHKKADREAERILKTRPTNTAALLVRARAAHEADNPRAALRFVERARESAPCEDKPILFHSAILFETGSQAEAIEVLENALRERESWPIREALGLRLMAENRDAPALDVFQKGLEHTTNGSIFQLIGICLTNLDRKEEAIQSFDLGIRIAPEERGNYIWRAFVAETTKNNEARVYYLKAISLNQHDNYAKVHFLRQCLNVCDWTTFDKIAPDRLESLCDGPYRPDAWQYLSLADDPVASLELQRAWQADRRSRLGAKSRHAAPSINRSAGARIRIGYYTSDFYNHATLRLFSGVMRHHDESKFEIYFLDYGNGDDFSAQTIASIGTGRHLKIKNETADNITRLSRRLNLDIAVDLKGMTFGCRTELFFMGQAPIQINYLGYPGTMGSTAYQYIIGDAVVTPPENERHFAERVIRLPTCYLPWDDERRAGSPPTRADVGLPEDAIVLACMNNHYKISREVFRIWMSALKATPGAVLWLLEGTEECRENLRGAAAAEGISPDRLIFAPKTRHETHIDRLALADLYLDTFNVNGHTLSAEAICSAGVPSLTRIGNQFAARVGASFMTAAGLPDLVCRTAAEYETKLVALAGDPAALRASRRQLATNRGHRPLFSSATYTRLLERGLTMAHERARQNLPPVSFDVPETVRGRGEPT